jgi:hypothetical protein
MFLLALSIIEEASAAVHPSPERIIVLRIQAVVIAAGNVTFGHFVFFNICLFVAMDPQVANKNQVLHNCSFLRIIRSITNDPNVAAGNYIP